MKFSELNCNQQKAYRKIKEAYNYTIGGYENSISDGEIEKMPCHKDLIYEIYNETMKSDELVKEIRFVGTEFIKERIEGLLNKEGY